MKRVFRFKKGQNWDGDEAIFDFIEDNLLSRYIEGLTMPQVKQDTKITVIIEKKGK